MFSFYLRYKYFHILDVRRGIEISQGRFKITNDLVNKINELKIRKNDLNSYLAEDEARFVDYYVKGTFVNSLPFSESYASTLYDESGKFTEIIKSINLSKHEFIKTLYKYRVGCIIALGKLNNSNDMKIDIQLSKGYVSDSYYENAELIIPRKYLNELLSEGFLIAYPVSGYVIYLVTNKN